MEANSRNRFHGTSSGPSHRMRASGSVGRVYRLIVSSFAVIGILMVIYHVGFNVAVIYTPSMAPTLQGEPGKSQDVVLIEKISYWFHKPHRWDVVQFQQTNEYWSVPVMKRIVALPGETVFLKDHRIVINDKLIERPEALVYLNYQPLGKLYGGEKFYCKQGYFVLGDYSFDSNDSRYEGELPEKAIEGRAWLIIWPLSRWGWVLP